MKQPWGNTWGKEELSLAVLHIFEDLQEFIDLNLLQALMQFLQSFPPPWWSKKIDQIDDGSLLPAILLPVQLHSFPVNGHMLHAVPPPLTMLNTSLYNLNVWNKWDLEHFVASDWDINEGRTCWGSAQEHEPFKIPEDNGNDLTYTLSNRDREGWLLTDNCLYFEYVAYKEPGGIISQEN